MSNTYIFEDVAILKNVKSVVIFESESSKFSVDACFVISKAIRIGGVIEAKRYLLIQGLERLTDKHSKLYELKRGLLNAQFYTEEEMVATILDLAEEGTFFKCVCIGFDVITFADTVSSYAFVLRCDDYIVDGAIDKDALHKAFINKKGEE